MTENKRLREALVKETIAHIDMAIQSMIEKGIVKVSYDEYGQQTLRLTELGRMIEDQEVN